MFVRIASATERIFSAFTQRSRRPAAGLRTLSLVLVAVLILPELAITPSDAQSLRARRAVTPRSHTHAFSQTAKIEEKDAVVATEASHLDFGFVKAGETSTEKEATFTFNRTVTLGKIEVLTMGAPNLDFTDAHSGTCDSNRTYKAGDSCTVRVNVTPKIAGERKGAVVLSDSLGERVGTLFVAAVTSKPVLLFPSSGAVTDLSVDNNNGLSGLTWDDPEGLALDGSGNIYVVDTAYNSLYKLAAGTYARTTIDTDNGSGSLDGPFGVAVDGSGNVYVAASGLTDNANPTVFKYAGGSASSKSVVGSGWTSPNAVAIDGSGNVYVADFGGGLFKVSGSTVTQIGRSGTTGVGANDYAVAVDASGNVYVAVWTNFQVQGTVYKETWNGGNSYTESEVSASFVTPTSIAVQPSGNLYVSDDNDTDAIVNGVNGFIYQETWNGSSWSQSTFSTAIPYPEDVVLDANGNLYIANYADSSGEPVGTPPAGIYEESFTTPPSLAFGTVNVGSTSTAKTVTIENTGNLALTFYSLSASENPTLPAGYIFGTGNTCPEVAANSSNGGLAIGASCTLSISFKPANNGTDNGSVVLTDNDDNLVDTTQSISVTGTGTGGAAPAITSSASTSFTLGTAGTFTVTTTGTPKPALSESGALPGGVNFTDNGNGTATLAGTPATTGTFTITITAASGVTPNATQTFTLTVSGSAPTITSSASAIFTIGSAGSFTVTTSGTPKSALSETGPLPAGLTFVDNGNGTATISGTPSGSIGGTDTITIIANNGIAPNASQTFTLTVNQAPAFTSSNAATFTVGTAGSFTLTASGFPSPTFSTAATLPSGVTLSTSGVLSGTPAAGTGNVYAFTVTASNGIGSDATLTFTLTVNQAPAITSGSTTAVTLGSSTPFTVTTSSYPKPALSETGSLPGGITFVDNGNGTASFVGTPTTSGSFPITITASNGVGSNAVLRFTLTVNAPPSITSGTSTTFTVGSPGTFAVTTTGFPVPTLSEAGALPGGVTFVDNGNGSATLAGTPVVSGSFLITITASNGIGSNATQSFTLIAAQTPQTITFPSPVVEPVLVGGSALLSATTTSGLPVGFLSGTTSVCTVTGSVGGSWTVSLITIGQCSIEAYQWGNSTYKVAAPAFQNFYVHGLAQTITVTPITGTVTADSSAIGLSAIASSSLPVTFTSKTPTICAVVNVVGWQLVAGAKGTCTIVATQTGNSTYTAATPVTTTVLIHGQSQTITFPAIPEPVTAGTSVILEATASSTLPVTYASVHPTVCTVSQSSGGVWSASLLTVGTCSIAAAQSGNSAFASAANVSQNFYVHPTP